MSKEIFAFVEDETHEQFIGALVKRIADENGLRVRLVFRNSTGGSGKALREAKQFFFDLEREGESLPDLIIVAIDSNCKTFSQKKKEIEDILKDFAAYQSGFVVLAIPYPHVERWLLLDPNAFKSALGRGCKAPGKKCDRDIYKEHLTNEIRKAGIIPGFGGQVFAKDIVKEMDLEKLKAEKRETLGRFIKDLEGKLKDWIVS